jgi:transposase-like protein
MGRISCKKIVEDERIYSSQDLEDMRISESTLEEAFLTLEGQNVFLARLKIIKNTMVCEKCNGQQQMSYVKRKSSVDGYVWICKKPCNASKSIRSYSFLNGCRLKIKTIFKVLYKYINGICQGDIAYDLNINRESVFKYGEISRQVICNYVSENNERIGGFDGDGLPKIVEIDESLFFRRKYNRGRQTSGQWYVGGVERGTKRAFLVPVVNRSALTMTHVILNNVAPGTIIITDEWRAYRRAMREIEGYQHRTVNHSFNFVDPVDVDIHTQNIEGFWSLSKRFLRGKHGINQGQHFEYLLQFIWEFKIVKTKRFSTLLSLLRINL